MSQSVRVDLREATLSAAATLTEGDAVFIGLDNPPPVRSLLKVVVGEEERVFEVARVIEVVDEREAARGCYGTFVDAERLAEQDKVGSEHLEPGISGSGVPAPVVIMNTADMMLNERPEPEPEPESDAGESGESEASDEDGESGGSEAGESDASDEDGESDASGEDGESDASGEDGESDASDEDGESDGSEAGESDASGEAGESDGSEAGESDASEDGEPRESD